MSTKEPTATSDSLIGFAKASQPMTVSQFNEWQAQREATAISHKQKVIDVIKEIIKDETLASSNIIDEIYIWIINFNDEFPHISSPRSVSNKALIEFLGDRPIPLASLLQFFTDYTEAYQRVLALRASLGSGTGASEFPFSLANASSNGTAINASLENLHAYQAKYPSRALIFQLFYFAGCIPDEIAIYTNTEVLEVTRIIENMRFDVITPTLLDD